jgi:hypothetical protein
MDLPLNLVIDRTSEGRLRAQLAGHPESAVEAANVTGLLNAVQDTFLQFLEDDEALRQAAVRRTPDRETLEKLASRYPVPDDWPEGDEDWDDAP